MTDTTKIELELSQLDEIIRHAESCFMESKPFDMSQLPERADKICVWLSQLPDSAAKNFGPGMLAIIGRLDKLAEDIELRRRSLNTLLHEVDGESSTNADKNT